MAKSPTKRVILEEVSEITSKVPAEDEEQYEVARQFLRVLNSDYMSSSGKTMSLPLPGGDSENPSSWLIRFREDEVVDVETTDVNGEKAVERKPRVSWGLCTTLGLGQDTEAVTLVMGDGLLKVGKIKVEGKGSKPAREVMERLAVDAH